MTKVTLAATGGAYAYVEATGIYVGRIRYLTTSSSIRVVANVQATPHALRRASQGWTTPSSGDNTRERVSVQESFERHHMLDGTRSEILMVRAFFS
jgi:hypothetical protein